MNSTFLDVILGVLNLQENSTVPWNDAVTAVVNRYSESVHIFVLDPDINISDFLATSLRIPLVLNASYTDHQNQAEIYLVLCSNVASVINLLQDTTITFARALPWIVSVPTIKGVETMFEQFFSHGVLDVVAVCPIYSAVNIYTYYPFTSKACHNFEPVLMVDFTSANFNQTDLFPKTKMNNLHNCPVRTLLFPFQPEIPHPSQNLPTFSRPMGELVGIMIYKMMKFHPVYSYPSDINEGIESLVKDPRLVSLGLPPMKNELDYGNVLVSKCISWCIPVDFNVDHNMIALAQIFHFDMWIACALALVAATVVAHYLVSRSTFSSWMFVLSVVVEGPAPIFYKERKVRFFVTSLYIAFLVINTMFKARLHSLMAALEGPNKMTTASQVYNSGLKLYDQNDHGLVHDSAGNIIMSPGRRQPYDRSNQKSVQEVLGALKAGTGAILVNSEFCKTVAIAFGKTLDGYYKVYALPTCIVTNFASYFGFSKYSPFAGRIKEVTASMREYGLSERLLRTPLPKEILSSVPQPIDMDDILLILLLWVAGLLSSTVVFVVEFFAPPESKITRLPGKRFL